MTRDIALQKIRALVGQDLRRMAGRYGVTVFLGGRLNKGWAGQTLERAIGLPISNSGDPDGGDWELKLTSLRRERGTLAPKETMAITMLDPVEIAARQFRESRLYKKLARMIVCGRVYQDRHETQSILAAVGTFDLDQATLDRVQADYELVRDVLRASGFEALTGRMGELVQPRTKGPGHGSTSRAFYARKAFVAHLLGLSTIIAAP